MVKYVNRVPFEDEGDGEDEGGGKHEPISNENLKAHAMVHS